MGRKLKAKFKSNNGSPAKILRKKRIRKKPPKYEKMKCVYTSDGHRCKRNAVGKGDLCQQHGGERIVKEDLIKYDEADNQLLSRTKFNPAVHPIEFIKLSKEGMCDVEIAAEFGVGVVTLRNWSETFEEFATAYEVGQAMFESWWIHRGRENIENSRFNTSLYKFLTGNKLGYSDKIEQKNMNMNLSGVLVVPAKVSEEQWEAEGDILNAKAEEI
jgi:hypothetical protein